jgi:hypothetical protein
MSLQLNMKLTYQETKKVIELYFSSDCSPTETARRYNLWAAANNATLVNRKNVIDVMTRFDRDKPFHKTTRQRSSLVRNDDVVFKVLGSLGQQPGRSIRHCAEENQLNVRTTHYIARRVLKLKPYRLTLMQTLTEYDKLVRIDACQRLLNVITDDKLIIYSDEATFRLDGHVNLWNCVVWDYERPCDFYVQQQQGAPHVTVWAALTRNHLFGPYFFANTVTSDSYCAILTEFFIPDLLAVYGSTDFLWFQQDGAPAHFARDTIQLITAHFQDRIVSRGCLHEWPPRSPDLTPCDFYLWGVVRDMVYRNGSFASIEVLSNALIETFRQLRQHKMGDVERAALSVRERLQDCIALSGAQLIHR